MKVLYLLPIDLQKYNGVLFKVKTQVSTWLKLGADVKVLVVDTSNTKIENTPLKNIKDNVEVFYTNSSGGIGIEDLKVLLGLNSKYSEIENSINNYSPDVIYARSSYYQPIINKIGKKFPLVFETNTNTDTEYKAQAYDSLKYFFRYLYNKFTKCYFLKEVDGIVSVTHEIKNKIKHFDEKNIKVIPNSIVVEEFSDKCRGVADKKRLFFIGSGGMAWHGIDQIINFAKLMPEYNFDIVGILESDLNIIIPENVKMHGPMTRPQYLPILEKATATIGSVSFYRLNMHEACPLKVREYLACRKPVIMPYLDTAFMANSIKGDFPNWVLNIHNKENTLILNIEIIKNFIKKCENIQIETSDVIKYIDTNRLEEERLNFMKQYVLS